MKFVVFLISSLPRFEFLGFIPYDQAIVDADIANVSVVDASQEVVSEVRSVYQGLLSAQVPGSAN